jgi:DHA2 family multidrug resistance protein-like MFS transporter
MAVSVLDSSITNIALPAIARDFAVAPGLTIWVVTAYQIAIVMSLLPVAALGERLGYLRVYTGGLVVFVALSLACSRAWNLPVLAAFRFLQGLGAAAMMGVNGAVLRHIWPRHLLGRGIGYNAMVIAVTAAAGPVLAGQILAIADWPWLFLINLPVGGVALFLLMRFGPRTPPETTRFDWADALLSAAMLAGLFFAASDLAHGVWSWRPALAGCLGVIIGVITIGRMRVRPRPLIPFDLFRLAPLRWAYAGSICAFAAQMSLLVALPFLLVHTRDLSPAHIGLLVLPLPIGLGVTSPLGGRFADRAWAGRMSAGGLVLLAAALAAIASGFAVLPLWLLALCMGLAGAGFGLFQAPNNNVMLRTGPIDRAGAAAGMLAQCRLVGQTLGALVAALGLHLFGARSGVAIDVAAVLALLAAAFALRRAPPGAE